MRILQKIKALITLYFLLNGFVVYSDEQKMSLKEFKEKLISIYTESNSTKNYKITIEKYRALKGKLAPGEENHKYEVGLDLSILHSLLKNKDYDELTNLFNELLKRDDSEFIFLEHYELKDNMLFEFWRYGLFQAELKILLGFNAIKRTLSIDDRVSFLITQAIKYDNVYYGRLGGTSSSTTYADECIHWIYFDKEIPYELKYNALIKLSEVLTESAKGNAFLSLALLDKSKGNKISAYENSSKCLEVLKLT